MRLGRVTAALESDGPYAQLGASRAKTFSAITEPVVLFVVFTVALLTGTDLPYALAATVRSSVSSVHGVSRAVIERIAADVDELARTRRARDLNTAAVLPDPRAERRRRLAEPDLEFRAFCAPPGIARASSTAQLERTRDAWQAGRCQRGETGQRPGYTGNPFRYSGRISS